MMDKERWNIRTDRDKMEKLIKYNILVKHKKCIFKKKKLQVAWNNPFFSMNNCFLRLRFNTPRPNWEIHMGWKNDI